MGCENESKSAGIDFQCVQHVLALPFGRAPQYFRSEWPLSGSLSLSVLTATLRAGGSLSRLQQGIRHLVECGEAELFCCVDCVLAVAWTEANLVLMSDLE